jgi:hypothetical protein
VKSFKLWEISRLNMTVRKLIDLTCETYKKLVMFNITYLFTEAKRLVRCDVTTFPLRYYKNM